MPQDLSGTLLKPSRRKNAPQDLKNAPQAFDTPFTFLARSDVYRVALSIVSTLLSKNSSWHLKALKTPPRTCASRQLESASSTDAASISRASRPQWDTAQDACQVLAPQDASRALQERLKLCGKTSVLVGDCSRRASRSRHSRHLKSASRAPQAAREDFAPQNLSGRLLEMRAKISRLKTPQERVNISRLKM
ncbi:hypothetical protein DFH08DRAFT_798255 [Mycena albidolilacea]|uniref:Uncharacterized protein n=1 Tax=Mycena albidolilacea TaxID=1033008 RepID=A0AAD7AN11_9AGAR|nr:hypothetical protein DFH08DRAFT_798255 [Mycena albidolilacea]